MSPGGAALPVFLTIGSKYLFTIDGKHHFNPSLFGVVMTLLFTGELITAAPAYQWGGTLAMSAFVIMLAAAGFVFRIGRGWLIASFLITYALQTGLRAWLMRAHMPPEMLFLGTLTSPPFFIFTFFMITDPRTSPASRGAQIGVGIADATLGFGREAADLTVEYEAEDRVGGDEPDRALGHFGQLLGGVHLGRETGQ